MKTEAQTTMKNEGNLEKKRLPGPHPPSKLPLFDYDPPAGPLSIIHHDDHILVIKKPSGLLTVPGKSEAHKDCLESRAQVEFPESRIVHRLDMDTSGLIILALSAEAHRHLGLQFEKRYVSKTYRARVWGNIEGENGTIDLPLRCDWPNRPKQMVDHELGRSALTDWQVIKREQNTTDVLLFPKTGRSHQLRVHMLELGHPILGDNLYAHDAALKASNRLCLHAEELEIHHPADGERIRFKSPAEF